ncbi:hypothetical protein SKA80_14825, partial [Enterococcus faecium]
MKKEELIDMFQIVERANNMGIMFFDRISLKMDLSVAHQEFNRIRQKSPILYRWVMNAVRYEGYR